ncbi:MAG: VWA domain-containing protein [bacterium]
MNIRKTIIVCFVTLVMITGCDGYRDNTGNNNDTSDNDSMAVTSPLVDQDADGYLNDVDCNDNDPEMYPGAPEICGDGIDQNCDGSDLACPPAGGLIDTRAKKISPTEFTFEVDVFVVDGNSDPIHSLHDQSFTITDFTSPSGTHFSFSLEYSEPLQTPYQGGYSAVLLMDQSKSVTITDPQDLRINAAKIFFHSLGPNDNALLAAFASGGNIPYQFTSWGGFGKSNYDAVLDTLAANEGGGTPLYDAAITFIHKAESNAPNHNRAVILFTDGVDTASTRMVSDVVTEAEKSDVKVFTVGLSNGVNQAVLSQMSIPTGGSMMFASDASKLISLFGALGNLLEGDMAYYRTCWRLTSDKELFSFWLTTSVNITIPDGSSISVPIYIEID